MGCRHRIVSTARADHPAQPASEARPQAPPRGSCSSLSLLAHPADGLNGQLDPVGARSVKRGDPMFSSHFAGSAVACCWLSGPNRIPAFAQGHPDIEAAIAFARTGHAGQLLGDGRPFVAHPLEVASRLHRMHAPDYLVIAGALHDLVEKAGVSKAQIRLAFGARVARLVSAVTDDESIAGYAERKAALRHQVAAAGHEALTLFAADKLSMSRELRREFKRDRDTNKTLRARRLTHYQRSLAMLEERLPESPLVGDLRRELRAYEQERAALRA